jgi:hypothetical protein
LSHKEFLLTHSEFFLAHSEFLLEHSEFLLNHSEFLLAEYRVSLGYRDNLWLFSWLNSFFPPVVSVVKVKFPLPPVSLLT